MNAFVFLGWRNMARFLIDAMKGRHRSIVDEPTLVVIMALRDEVARCHKALEIIADGGAEPRTIASWALRRPATPRVRA